MILMAFHDSSDGILPANLAIIMSADVEQYNCRDRESDRED